MAARGHALGKPVEVFMERSLRALMDGSWRRQVRRRRFVPRWRLPPSASANQPASGAASPHMGTGRHQGLRNKPATAAGKRINALADSTGGILLVHVGRGGEEIRRLSGSHQGCPTTLLIPLGLCVFVAHFLYLSETLAEYL